jgi:hypothetical protein
MSAARTPRARTPKEMERPRVRGEGWADCAAGEVVGAAEGREEDGGAVALLGARVVRVEKEDDVDEAEEVDREDSADELDAVARLLGSTVMPVLVGMVVPVKTVYMDSIVATTANAWPEGTANVPSPDVQSQSPLAASDEQHQRLSPHGVRSPLPSPATCR